MLFANDLSLFKCGTHVSIIGTIKFSQHPYIWVTDINVHSENVENISKVLKGSSILKKPSMENMNGGNIVSNLILLFNFYCFKIFYLYTYVFF